MEGGNLNGSGEQSNDSRDNRERQATMVEMMVIITLVVIATRGGTVFYETSTILEFGVNMPPPPPPPAPVEAEASPDFYYCWCGREFQIIEEMSDHMASHYLHATAQTGVIPPPDEGCSSSQLPPKKRQSVEREHKCRICGKRFPTGQALGGHMRAHYQGDLSRLRHGKNKNVAIASSAASVAVGDHSLSMSVNNGNNDVVPEVEVEVVEESTVVEHVGDEPGEVSSHPRLDIDLNVKLDEVFEEEEAQEAEEDDHSDGD